MGNEEKELKKNEKQSSKSKAETSKKQVKKPATTKKTGTKKAKTTETKTKKEVKEKKEEKNNLIKKQEIVIPYKEIEKRIQEIAKQYQPQAKVQGFRIGKAPLEFVIKKYEKEFIEQAIGELIEKKALKIIKDENLNLLSPPMYEKLNFEKGKDLKVELIFELYPEINIPELEKLEIDVTENMKKLEYDEKKVIDMILDQNKYYNPVVDRGIKDKDFIVIIHQAKEIKTKRFLPREELQLVIDEKTEIYPTLPIKELNKEIIGKNKGDKLQFTRKYEKDYQKKRWANREMEHNIEIKAIYEEKRPELDKNLYSKYNAKDEAEFKKIIKESYDKTLDREKQTIIENAILDKLNKEIDFIVPEESVNNEYKYLLNENLKNPATFKDRSYEEINEELKKEATKRVKLRLIFSEIQKKFNIKVEDKELRQEMKNIATANNLDLKQVESYYNKEENKEFLVNSLLSKKIIDLIKEKVKIKGE